MDRSTNFEDWIGLHTISRTCFLYEILWQNEMSKCSDDMIKCQVGQNNALCSSVILRFVSEFAFYVSEKNRFINRDIECSCGSYSCSYSNRGWCYLIGASLPHHCAGAIQSATSYHLYWTKDKEICERSEGMYLI